MGGWKPGSLVDWLAKFFTEETGSGDEGINCLGELHIGSPGNGKELCGGEGDSHTIGMVVFSTEDDITFVDYTEEAASGSGSTYPTFGGFLTVGAADYFGSDDPICGIKLKTASLVNPGSGSVAREYWNGSAWVSFTSLATNSDAPYQQRADNMGTVVGSEQVRFGNCDDQVKISVNGVEKYWIRLRITGALTSSGTIEQIKLHTNRFEINADGFSEYFGNGIYRKDLVMHWNLTEQLVGFSPANENIVFANGLTLAYTDNEFTANAIDGRGGYLIIPIGMDTSKSLELEFIWIPLTNAAGDVVYKVDTYQTKIGEVIDSGNTVESVQGTVAVALNSDNLLIQTTIPINVQHLLPGEILAIGFKRVGNDVGDTFTGSIAMINVRAIGSFWHP